MAQVTKQMLIGELLQLDPNIAGVLMRAGMLHRLPVFPDGVS